MTGTRILAPLAAVVLAIAMSACDGFRPSPFSPTPITQPAPATPPAAPSTLSGQVFITNADGRAPVEGVRVYCDACGPLGHSDVFSDGTGAYSFAGVANGLTTLLVFKSGFRLSQPSGPGYGGFGEITTQVIGDTRFDIELVRQ